MSTKLIPGFSRYSINKDGVITDTTTGKIMSSVTHRGTEAVNLVDNEGNKKRTKLQNLIDKAFPENLPGMVVEDAPSYRVTEDGRLYSTIQGRWISGAVGKNGYETVHIRESKNSTIMRYIHTLVAKAFVEGYFVGATVNHIDGNKRNNHKSNLEWITKVDNVKHAWKSGLCDSKHKKCEISKDGIEWIKFDKLVDAKAYLENTGAKLANVSHLVRAAKQNEGLDTPKYLCRGFYIKYSN